VWTGTSRAQEGIHMTNIDTLREQAEASGSGEDMDRLWRETYKLDQWYFIARGKIPNVHPFIGVVEDKQFLFAFTDEQHAMAFAQNQGFTDEKGNSMVLSMPVNGFIESSDQYRYQGVFGILFNEGPHGYFAPLDNLVPMYKHFSVQESQESIPAAEAKSSLEDSMAEIRKEPITAKDKIVGMIIAILLIALCVGVWLVPDLIPVDSLDVSGRGGRKIARFIHFIWSRPVGSIAGVIGLIVGWGAITKKVGEIPGYTNQVTK